MLDLTRFSVMASSMMMIIMIIATTTMPIFNGAHAWSVNPSTTTAATTRSMQLSLPKTLQHHDHQQRIVLQNHHSLLRQQIRRHDHLYHMGRGHSLWLLPAPYFEQPEEEKTPAIATTTTKTVSSGTSNDDSESSSSTSLWQWLDEAGLALKPTAVRLHDKAMALDTASSADTTDGSMNTTRRQLQKYMYLAASTVLYLTFILYRGYRGFFVILPAVFRETFSKLQNVVDETPFEMANDGTTSSNTSTETTMAERQRPNWRTRGTIGVLATIVTLAYVVGGGLRVGRTLVATALTSKKRQTNNTQNPTSSSTVLLDSLQAAAREQERNEQTILSKTKKNKSTPSPPSSVNGQDFGLAP